MTRRWALTLGSAVLGLCGHTAAAGEPESITHLPRALPGKNLNAPVVGLAKQSAFHPPANGVPQPPTTPPAFTPNAPSIYELRDADCCAPGAGFCDSCCEQHAGYYVSVGFYHLQPFWDNNPSYHHYVVADGVATRGGQQDFRHDYELVPVVSAGCRTGDGFGLRGRFWNYDQGASDIFLDGVDNFLVSSAGPLGLRVQTPEDLLDVGAVRLVTNSDLEITVFDVEATQDLRCGAWWLTVAGGLRCAHLSQEYNAQTIRITNPAVLATLVSEHEFNGAGPTLAIEAHRPTGWFGFGVYGSGRGSILYGSAEQIASLRATPNRNGAYSHEDLMPVLELEVGVEWRGCLAHGELFFQTGVISQTWFGAGNASRSTTALFQDGGGRGDPASTDVNLGFFGLSLAVGARY